MNDILELIDRARSLVDRGWATGCLAKDGAGRPVHELSPKAASWCLVGAFHRAAWDMDGDEEEVEKIKFDLMLVLGAVNMTRFNDKTGRTKGEILEWLDKVRSSIIAKSRG